MDDEMKNVDNVDQEEIIDTEYARGIIDTSIGLIKSILDADQSMTKGEEAIILTLLEKVQESSETLVKAEESDVYRTIGVLSTTTDTLRSVLDNDSKTDKFVIQMLNLVNDKMAEAIDNLQ